MTDKGQMLFDLETAIKIHKPYGGYKSYGLLDKKVKEELTVQTLPFDNEKRVFEIQCSKDGENFVQVNPWGITNGNTAEAGSGLCHSRLIRFCLRRNTGGETC